MHTNESHIFTDSLSTLYSLKNLTIRNDYLHECYLILTEFQNIYLHFTPAHCGIVGNERADVLAGKAAKKENYFEPVYVDHENYVDMCRKTILNANNNAGFF